MIPDLLRQAMDLVPFLDPLMAPPQHANRVTGTYPQCADEALLIVSHNSFQHVQVFEHALQLAHVAALLELLLNLLPQRLGLGALDDGARQELGPAHHLLHELDVGFLVESVRR